MKKSVAYDHFPQVVSYKDRFWLFNSILRKRYENRPEERVRLQWVEYLLHQTDWKKTRIGFETPVKLRQSKNTLRADLVLYTDDMNPSTLIECKSNSVKLNTAAAEQAARYNSEMRADYLVLTNGIEDYWFEKNGEKIDQATNILHQTVPFSEIERDAEYWSDRGFCSARSNSELKNWLTNALKFFWSDEMAEKRQYLDFQTTALPVPMNQYYKLFEIDSDRRLAISFLGVDSSDTFLIGVLNSGGVNQGIVSINIERLERDEKDAVIIFSGENKRVVPASEFNKLNIPKFRSDQIKNLPQRLIKFFD